MLRLIITIPAIKAGKALERSFMHSKLRDKMGTEEILSLLDMQG